MKATFLDVLNGWPSDAQLAEDLGVSRSVVHKWRHKMGYIPSKHWKTLIRIGKRRGVDWLNPGLLTEMASKQERAL